MIGRRGFLQAIGACVLGLSIALRGEQRAQTFEPSDFDPVKPPEVAELQIWHLSKDNGKTWNDVPEGHPLEDGDILRWPKTHKHGWTMTTAVAKR
jgi:hypothetical protein